MPNAVLLIGAGASYGSDIDATPPLGNNLYIELKKFNPDSWGQLDLSLSNSFNLDFESGMIEIAKKFPYRLSVLQRAMAAYFFNYIPRQNNLYIKLSKIIKQKNWQGSIITINNTRNELRGMKIKEDRQTMLVHFRKFFYILFVDFEHIFV